MIFYLIIFSLICGLLKLSLNYKFMLINLLTMEFLILNLFMFMVLMYNHMTFEIYFLMIFLTISVCEGVFGISLLILMIRNYSNNYLQSLSIFLC